MKPKISFITLGTRDLPQMIAFYRDGLGFPTHNYTVVKPPQDVFWGGYSGYFADPEGNLWEVAYNPFTDLT